VLAFAHLLADSYSLWGWGFFILHRRIVASVRAGVSSFDGEALALLLSGEEGMTRSLTTDLVYPLLQCIHIGMCTGPVLLEPSHGGIVKRVGGDKSR